MTWLKFVMDSRLHYVVCAPPYSLVTITETLKHQTETKRRNGLKTDWSHHTDMVQVESSPPTMAQALPHGFVDHLPIQPHDSHLHTYQVSTSKETHTGNSDSHAVPRVTSAGDELSNTLDQRITLL